MALLPRYDVLVSYNAEDRIAAVALADELRTVGLKVWLDEWELRPGKTWQDELEAALGDVRTVAALVGPSGVGPWQSAEIQTALHNFMSSRRPVIPVLLAGADDRPQLPPFLGLHTWVDCRALGTSLRQLERLIWGITGRGFKIVLSEFGDAHYLDLDVPGWRPRRIQYRTLPNPQPNRLLHLSWGGFGEGIEILTEQIRNYGTSLGVDACFGINDAGLAMATFIGSAVFHRSSLGYLKCGNDALRDQVLADSLFPTLRERPVIALFDFEVKRSDVLGSMLGVLRGRYTDPEIYFLVFGAMTEVEDLRVSNIDQLVSAAFLKGSRIRDFFMAGTMLAPGIEPPLELR